MADRTVTLPTNTSEMGIPDPHNAEIHAFLADDPAVRYVGKMISIKSNRKATIADANGGGTLFQTVGLCVSQRGRALSVLKRGFVEGIDCENMTPGAPLFLSDTAGAVADAASATKTAVVGRAMPMTDGYGSDVRLLPYIDCPWTAFVP